MDRVGDVWRERAIRDAVLAGDSLAWRAWYDEHYCRLAGYVRWRCAGIADLEDDVLQETWLIAVKRLRSFDPARSSFAGWLFGIAANVIRNALRSRKRDRSKRRPLENEPAGMDDSAVPARAERVAAALAAINPLYESVLRAKYLDRQSVEEIAAAWNESAKAIESRLTRARQAFREVYEADRD